MRYIDAHCHLGSRQFDDDRNEVIGRMLEKGVEKAILICCSSHDLEQGMILRKQHPAFKLAMGIHPQDLEEDYGRERLERFEKSLIEDQADMIGEIGLDYYWDDTHKEEQKYLFHRKLSFACERDLPVIIHDREAHGDCLAITRQYPKLRGVFHCYSGSVEMAGELLKHGWYLGFDGPVTYKNARKSLEVLDACPVERILLETDSPYLAPVPNRGKRNDSRNIPYVAAKIAELKGISVEEVCEVTTANAKRLFGIR